MTARETPMTLAEASECCGQLHSGGFALEQCGSNFTEVCDNCPLLIDDQQRRVLRAARAM